MIRMFTSFEEILSTKLTAWLLFNEKNVDRQRYQVGRHSQRIQKILEDLKDRERVGPAIISWWSIVRSAQSGSLNELLNAL